MTTLALPRRSIGARILFWNLWLGLALLGSVIVAAANGPAPVPYGTTAAILLQRAGVPAGDVPIGQQRIVEQIRLPRILVAALVGAALAAAGAALQAVFRNPLADPGIVGVSGGAALAAVATIALFRAAPIWALPAAAFVGAMAALGAVTVLASAGGRVAPATLVLAGLAVQAFCGAGVSAALTMTNDNELIRSMLFWLTGGLDSRSWNHVQAAALVVLPGLAVLLGRGRDLNVLAQGEETAHGLGLSVGRVRLVVLLAAGLITAAAVAVSGTIAFVGLLVPHALRLRLGPDYRLLLPASMLGGATFLVLADTFARLVLQPAEIRVGVVTALLGAPFFLILLWRDRARVGVW